MEKVFLFKCKASKGQFSDELAVAGADYSGEEFSFFVNEKFVEPEGDVELGATDAHLQVELVERVGQLVLIRLPGRTFGNGSLITVKEDDLVQSECRSLS